MEATASNNGSPTWKNNISGTMKNGPNEQKLHYFSVINEKFDHDKGRMENGVESTGEMEDGKGQMEEASGVGQHIDSDPESDNEDEGSRINYEVPPSSSSSMLSSSGRISDFRNHTNSVATTSQPPPSNDEYQTSRDFAENNNENNLIMIDYDNYLLEQLLNKPMSFGTDNLTTVTAQVGATAHLSCIVHFIGGGMVCISVCLCYIDWLIGIA